MKSLWRVSNVTQTSGGSLLELKSWPSAKPFFFRSLVGKEKKKSKWSLMGTYVMVGAREIKEAARRN